MGEDASDLWWEIALRVVESMGPTFIKLAQWAATRQDIFPKAMTQRFTRLHTSCPSHALRHTEDVLHRSIGPDWKQRLTLGPLVGSGCVAQVYSATLVETGRRVAVKVLHPFIKEVVEIDMHLLRFLGEWLHSRPSLRPLSLGPAIATFERLMTQQLDLAVEGKNTEKMRKVLSFRIPLAASCSLLQL